MGRDWSARLALLGKRLECKACLAWEEIGSARLALLGQRLEWSARLALLAKKLESKARLACEEIFGVARLVWCRLAHDANSITQLSRI